MSSYGAIVFLSGCASNELTSINLVMIEKPGDAGLKDLDHCKVSATHYTRRTLLTVQTDRSRLPSWRYIPRQWLIPFLRKETVILGRFQKAIRSPALDSYFAVTANLGTLTFYMVFLPMLFWSGNTSLARAWVLRHR